jgi:hypothetical protein
MKGSGGRGWEARRWPMTCSLRPAVPVYILTVSLLPHARTGEKERQNELSP